MQRGKGMMEAPAAGKRRGTHALRWALAVAVSALAVNMAEPLHAGMGETNATVGVTITDAPDTIVLGCFLGAACADEDGVLYRLLSGDVASRVIRGGATLSTDTTISGIGFGSWQSSTKVSTNVATDTFCWSGVRRNNPGGRLSQGVRDCIRIFEGSGSVSGGTIVTVRRRQQECDQVAGFFEPRPELDYLVKIFPQRYGDRNAVEVVLCNGVRGQFVTDIREQGVTIDAHRTASGFNCKLKIGGVCYS